MKVALIFPEYYEIAHFGVKRKEIPPFGVLYLAAVIEQKGIEPTIKKSIGKWKKVEKIFLAKKHSKASYLQIAGLRYKN